MDCLVRALTCVFQNCLCDLAAVENTFTGSCSRLVRSTRAHDAHNVHSQINGSDPRWGGSCRHARCAEDDVYIEDGALVLRSQHRSSCFSGGSGPGCFNYSTGAVTTQNKMTVSAHPGFRLCVSAKLPGGGGGKKGQGIWPAHWMMPNDESCDPDEGELDILEMIDGDGYAHSTYHWQTTWPAKNCR